MQVPAWPTGQKLDRVTHTHIRTHTHHRHTHITDTHTKRDTHTHRDRGRDTGTDTHKETHTHTLQHASSCMANGSEVRSYGRAGIPLADGDLLSIYVDMGASPRWSPIGVVSKVSE